MYATVGNIQTANGGVISVGQVMVVNVGASNGPRVATASFNKSHYRPSPSRSVAISVDVDGRRYQDEGAIRRRAAQAAVGVGKRAATKILSGAAPPTVERTSRVDLLPGEPVWAQASWHLSETFEGYDRRVTVRADFKPVDEADLTPPAGLVKRAGDELMWLATNLHGSVDDPVNRWVFGGRDG